MNPALLIALERADIREAMRKSPRIIQSDDWKDKRESKPRYKKHRRMKLREAKS